jgi:hypothetical protein
MHTSRQSLVAYILGLSAALVVGVFVGYAMHESVVLLDRALEIDDLKNELQLEKQLAENCKLPVPHPAPVVPNQ